MVNTTSKSFWCLRYIKSMYKRIVIFFSLFMLSISLLILKIYSISDGGWLCDAAANQSTYRLDVAKLRGTIYDCRLNPMTGIKKTNVAAVFPCIESEMALDRIIKDDQRKDVFNMQSSGQPFKINIDKNDINCPYINVFRVPVRYTEDPLAVHIIGYIDEAGKGVCGIEDSYNDYLSNTGSCISVKYKVDALDRVLEGENIKVEDKSYLDTKGVVLTLDTRLQQISEKAAKRYIKKGAVIISEVPTCKIRACVSVPDYCPNDIEKYLNSEDCPLLNRAFCAYNVGSIFKLVTAATALENGLSKDYRYNCTGSIKVDDTDFNCFNGKGHDNIDMKEAIAYSCNSYFVNVSDKITGEQILNMSRKLGFGSLSELAPNMFSKKGNLPTQESLKDKKTMANFSFGQGTLLATPIQISGLINTIASDGKYCSPSLVEGLVNENLQFIKKYNDRLQARVISENTAKCLKDFMRASIEEGTSVKGKPQNGDAGAKTSTAETGIQIDGKNVIQAWYAGFYPFEKPKYSIVVLAEDAVGGGGSCGPVFKQIIDDIYNEMPGALLS